jgi:hypothetical protein
MQIKLFLTTLVTRWNLKGLHANMSTRFLYSQLVFYFTLIFRIKANMACLGVTCNPYNSHAERNVRSSRAGVSKRFDMLATYDLA